MKHSLSLLADSQFTPLIYQFGYNYTNDMNNYFHSAEILYESSLSDIYLPIGEYNIFGNVIDSKSSMQSSYTQCSIK